MSHAVPLQTGLLHRDDWAADRENTGYQGSHTKPQQASWTRDECSLKISSKVTLQIYLFFTIHHHLGNIFLHLSAVKTVSPNV